MKQALIFIIFIVTISSCVVQNKITSIEYVPKPFSVIANGNESPENVRLLIVCYNKYFNQERYSPYFITKNRLNTIDYKTNMAIEIFLGESTNNVGELKVEKIEENKDNVNVYYSYTELDGEKIMQTPFIIVQTSKSKKPVIYFDNGVQVKMPGSDIYIKN